MTATNVIIDNVIDYSSQLTSIATSLGSIATALDGLETIGINLVAAVNRLSTATEQYADTASLSYATVPTRDSSSGYFAIPENAPAPELTVRATWTGITSVITLFTPASKIVNGLRVEGQNIDAGTTVQSVAGTTITLSQPTLGTSNGYYRFYIN